MNKEHAAHRLVTLEDVQPKNELNKNGDIFPTPETVPEVPPDTGVVHEPVQHRNRDPVNHPPHYCTGKYEVIDVIADWKLNFNLGNVVKYLARAEHKANTLEDLKKAHFYLEYEIRRLEDERDGKIR